MKAAPSYMNVGEGRRWYTRAVIVGHDTLGNRIMGTRERRLAGLLMPGRVR